MKGQSVKACKNIKCTRLENSSELLNNDMGHEEKELLFLNKKGMFVFFCVPTQMIMVFIV